MNRIDYLDFARNTIGGALTRARHALFDQFGVVCLIAGTMPLDCPAWRKAVLGLICVTPFGGQDFEDTIDGWRQFHDLSYADAAEIVRRYGVDVAMMSMESGAIRFKFEELPTSLT